VRDVESGLLHERLNRAVQMATAGHPLPSRGQAVLPAAHTCIGGQPVFDEEEIAVRLEDAPRFPEGARDVGDRA